MRTIGVIWLTLYTQTTLYFLPLVTVTCRNFFREWRLLANCVGWSSTEIDFNSFRLSANLLFGPLRVNELSPNPV